MKPRHIALVAVDFRLAARSRIVKRGPELELPGSVDGLALGNQVDSKLSAGASVAVRATLDALYSKPQSHGELREEARESHALLVQLSDRYNQSLHDAGWSDAFENASLVARHQLLAG